MFVAGMLLMFLLPLFLSPQCIDTAHLTLDGCKAVCHGEIGCNDMLLKVTDWSL